MRRIARFLFAACAAGSLAACVGACGLWARSYTERLTVSHATASWDGGIGVAERRASALVSRGNFAYAHATFVRAYLDPEDARTDAAAVRRRLDRGGGAFRFEATAPSPLN